MRARSLDWGDRRKDESLRGAELGTVARIDPQLLAPVKHRSAQAQADLTVIRARAGLAVWRRLKAPKVFNATEGTAVKIVGTDYREGLCRIRIRPAAEILLLTMRTAAHMVLARRSGAQRGALENNFKQGFLARPLHFLSSSCQRVFEP
jgi:hypothetical protein